MSQQPLYNLYMTTLVGSQERGDTTVINSLEGKGGREGEREREEERGKGKSVKENLKISPQYFTHIHNKFYLPPPQCYVVN